MKLPIKIDLPDSFLDPEIRSGYEVSSKLKKIWAVELDLVCELKRVCNKHGIRFMLAYGTLIGAVRHKGFIPWDDDFDVWICRDDFMKLCQIGQSEFKHPYFLQTALSDGNIYFPYARLRNSETTGAIVGHEIEGYNNGIYIDIYVVDGYTENRFFWNVQTILRAVAIKACTLRWPKRDGGGFFHKLFDCLRPFMALIPKKSLYRICNWVLSLFNGSSRRFGPRYRMHPKAWQWWIERSAFDDLIEMPYENQLLPCPRNFDAHLRRMYGDYMKFPDPKERGKWHEGIIQFEPDIPYREWMLQNSGGVK